MFFLFQRVNQFPDALRSHVTIQQFDQCEKSRIPAARTLGAACAFFWIAPRAFSLYFDLLARGLEAGKTAASSKKQSGKGQRWDQPSGQVPGTIVIV